MNRSTLRISPLPLLIAMAMTGPGSAQPQPGDDLGPLVVGQRRSLTSLSLDHLDASINVFGRWREDERTVPGQPEETDSEFFIQTDLELNTRLFVGSKDLLDINSTVRLGLERTDIDSDTTGESRDDLTTLVLYDVSGLILAQGPAPLTVYSRRQQTFLDREFSGSTESTNIEHGASLRIRSDEAPTLIQVFHRDIKQEDRISDGDYRIIQNTVSVRSDPILDEQNQLNIEYTFDSIDERQRSAFGNEFNRHDLLVTHTLNFGPENEHSLRSMGQFFDESGLFEQRRVRLDELLRLEHTDRFETQYSLTLEKLDQVMESQEFARGSVLLRHRLFESLVTTASAGGSRLEVPGVFDSEQVFADLKLKYTKLVPLGRLEASAGIGADRLDDSERGSPVSILDQLVTFSGAGPEVIGRANVVAGSIVVTDLAGVQVFIEGVDYTERVLPDRVELFRIVGGDIADGQSVLVDLTVGPQPAGTIDSRTVGPSLRYTVEEGLLKGLSPYARFGRTDRSVDSESPENFFVDDVQDLTYGIDYRRGAITLGAEQQHRDSDFSPFDVTRLEARYDKRLGAGSSLSVSYSYEDIEYPLDDDRLQLNRITARLHGRLNRRLEGILRLTFRDEDSGSFGSSTGFEQSAEFTWRRGQTTISASVRNATLDTDRESRLAQSVWFELRRTF